MRLKLCTVGQSIACVADDGSRRSVEGVDVVLNAELREIAHSVVVAGVGCGGERYAEEVDREFS
jgi:hypothetical protein